MKTITEIIFEQLGGNRFLVMTGANHLMADGSTLRMQLPKNISGANRLYITLNENDLYTMRFFKYTAPRLNTKTFEFSKEKIKEIEIIDDVFCDMLQDIFTRVTGMYTHL